MASLASNSEIRLVPIGAVDRDLLDYLAFALAGMFDTACIQADLQIDASDAYNSTRQQYHSTQLLGKLHNLSEHGGKKILGVTSFDLFIPIFTFVFGEAQVGGSVALMSAHRLRQEFYGLPGNRDLFFARAEKEATHELGHAFGLTHCRSFDCVMRFSNSVEDVDMKASDFCTLCDAKLHAQLNSTMAA
jgi:archaemetzincin